MIMICLVFPITLFVHGHEPDTAGIRKINERATDFYYRGYYDSSQALAFDANKMANNILNGEETDHSKGSINHVKKLKAEAMNIWALSMENAALQAALDTLGLAVDLMIETGDIAEQARLYSSLGIIYDFQSQSELAMQYHNKSAALFREANDRSGLAMELTNIGISHRNLGNYGDAMENLLESLAIYRELNDSTDLVETLLAIGFVYLYVERWNDALKVQQQALEIYRGMNDSLGIARIFNDMGAVNMAAGNYQKALEQHQKALKIRLKSNEYYYTFASYFYIASIYESLEHHKQALNNYESALEFAKRNGSRVAIVDALFNVGNIMFKLGESDRAMEHFMKAQEMSSEMEDRTGQALASMKIAEIHNLRNQPYKALQWLESAEEAVPNSSFAYLEEIYFGIAKTYEQLGDYQNAFANMERYGQVKDSVTRAENLEKVTMLTNRMEFESRQALQRESQEKMIKLKQAEIDRQKILRNFILFGMFVILVMSVIFYIRFTEKTRLNKKLNKAFIDLKSTQAQLIHAEKMASLGELTAGVAHEIQNPLNFVNNFSEVNAELIAELKEELEAGNLEEVKAIAGDIAVNEEKINHHGKRADAIVRGMLQHSRSSGGEKVAINLNSLADEYLRLSFHGMRAKDKSFQSEFITDFDENLPKINVVPQDLGRVFLNLINNAFYAVNKKRQHAGEGFKPQVKIKTSRMNDQVVIKIIDNGDGIPENIAKRIFQPFFTTKPTGEGTGLGLSLSYDIITKGHGGKLKMNTTEGKGTEFIITLSK
ncbi:MAG: tetratricopeptide repeat protein [Bacteroidota bacterium]|nr:tetratricopeptide repeat protein [Bacteroidota bacterium]